MPTIAVSGPTGLIGTALCRSLAGSGATVLSMVRPGGAAPAADGVAWDPLRGVLTPERLAGVDAVVHLAGENIAAGRWTAAQKQRIYQSRVEGTGALARSLAALPHQPGVLVCASAVGFYGDRGDETLDEDSAPGTGFLAETCVAWERAAEPARAAGIRVVHLRIGMVLAADGGALAKMRLPFRLGLGGPVGSGRQFVSWIGLDDLVAAIRFAIERSDLVGPVNATAPGPVTNRDFARALGRALHRPAFLPLPAFAARLLLGEMADGLLLASQRVLPRRLQAAGFAFRHADIDAALAAALAG